MKRIIAVLLTILMVFSLTACGGSEAEDNVAFKSLEEMQDFLNGKWFSIESLLYPHYTEIVFNNDEIKKGFVYGWSTENDVNKDGEIIGTKYILTQYDSLEFKNYTFSNRPPEFQYKTGKVQFDAGEDIEIKEYVTEADGKVIKENFLLIGDSVFFKATDSTDLSCDNFKTFLRFCEMAISNNDMLPFTDMYYTKNDEGDDTKGGIEERHFFLYEGCDSDEISFEIFRKGYSSAHYFARTDEFGYLYDEIKDVFSYRTNIIGLIGTEMSDFEKKKDWAKNHSFRELKYYLYMNSEGKLISNIS